MECRREDANTAAGSESPGAGNVGTVVQSALENVIAHGLPAMDEILFLRAARPLARGAIMGMEMRGPIHDGILQVHVTLQPLM